MKKYLLLLLIAVTFWACNNDSAKQPADSTSEEEGFLNFKKRFLRDTAYQMAHITFPLDGIPDKAHEGDTLPNGQFYWTKENWDLHQELDPARSGFEVKYTWLSDNLVEETLINKQVGLGMMRRFSKRGEEWELIYYVALNSVRQ
jgi:hypothetical protein